MHVTYDQYGPVGQVVSLKNGEPHAQDEVKIWTGSISAARDNSMEREAKINQVFRSGALDAYYVACDSSAPTRCIDGRMSEHYKSQQQRPLGSQVPGGTALGALTDRIINANDITRELSFVGDIDHIVHFFKANGIAFGGHIDNQDHPEGNTGCGAIDKIPEILQRIAMPASQQQLRGLAALLLGEAYDEQTADGIIGRIIRLQSVAMQYFEIDPHTGSYAYKQRVIKELRKNSDAHDPVGRLIGLHREVGVIVNTVAGTTFDTDRFNVNYEGDIQLFNYDFWFSRQATEILYPVNNAMAYARAKRHLRLQHEYLTCRVLLAVATLMTLTDGSVKLVVRQART